MARQGALTKFIPEELIAMKKSEIVAVVKATDSDTLHETYSKMAVFMTMFTDALKEEFIKRAKEFKKREETFETTGGKIVMATRNNYKFDEEKIQKFLAEKGIAEEEIYDVSYMVETKDPKVLADLLKKGAISKKLGKIRPADYEALGAKYPKLLSFVTNEPTEYLKGL